MFRIDKEAWVKEYEDAKALAQEIAQLIQVSSNGAPSEAAGSRAELTGLSCVMHSAGAQRETCHWGPRGISQDGHRAQKNWHAWDRERQAAQLA